MISEQIAQQIGLKSSGHRVFASSFVGHAQLASVLVAVTRNVGRAIAEWMKRPVLPYAALWEASMTVDLIGERQD